MSKKSIIFQVLIVIAMIAWLFGMNSYVDYYNSKEFSYTMGTESDTYESKMTIVKHWNETSHGYGYGIQYDVRFDNKSLETLYDWSAKIALIKGCQLTDYWNGEMTFEDNVIYFNPQTDIEMILPESNRTFGFILYSQKLNNVEEFTIYYHKKIGLNDLPMFTAWKIALGIFAVLEIIIIATALRTWKIRKKQKEFESIVNQSFKMFANLIDAKDPYTLGHSRRVALYSKELAKRMGISQEERDRLYYIALLHDIGKIGITDAILNKKGKLTPEERAEIEKHVTIGGAILKDFTALKGIAEGAKYHHERYDGTGYATGIKGEKIPLFARIIAVADSFDAMSSERCYRPKLEMPVIIEELKNGSGTQFDPKIAALMLEMIEEGVVPIDLEEYDDENKK
ncbi:MAG: HD-GYP domain-containing protein [Lachnospiraceae bacterium]|nr:HD-GYP domain-containing protein [Lachnospiraceae bacterium]